MLPLNHFESLGHSQAGLSIRGPVGLGSELSSGI